MLRGKPRSTPLAQYVVRYAIGSERVADATLFTAVIRADNADEARDRFDSWFHFRYGNISYHFISLELIPPIAYLELPGPDGQEWRIFDDMLTGSDMEEL